MFIDPDGDGIDYLELQVNPLGTRMDLLMSKSCSDGGSADFDWNLEGFSAAISVDGTLNKVNDTDTMWICEVALPFEQLVFSAPSLSFPPDDGTSWRINLYRYEYIRDSKSPKELSAWNQTDTRGFHAPDKFGRVIYSTEPVLTTSPVAETEALPGAFEITGNFPNPFNMATTIEYTVRTAGSVKLEVYNILGQNSRTLVDSFYYPGAYSVVWDCRNTLGEQVTSGLYIARMQVDSQAKSHQMLLLK
ncbi:hypothetical protein ACFL60_01265 [Candidatus Omnitrophota bacterium]